MSAKPRPITADDDLTQFDCGEHSRNEWLQERALDNEKSRASRTFVFADSAGTVFGYYCLSLNAVDRALGPGRFSRGQPRMVPVALIGRLAVDLRMAGRGLDGSLLQDAVNRALTIAVNAGMHVIVMEALQGGPLSSTGTTASNQLVRILSRSTYSSTTPLKRCVSNPLVLPGIRTDR